MTSGSSGRKTPDQTSLEGPRGHVTAKALLVLIEQQQYKCALTGRPLEPDASACDHKVPVSAGGSHHIENIQILYRDVNRAKGTMSVDDFIAMCCEVADHHRTDA